MSFSPFPVTTAFRQRTDSLVSTRDPNSCFSPSETSPADNNALPPNNKIYFLSNGSEEARAERDFFSPEQIKALVKNAFSTENIPPFTCNYLSEKISKIAPEQKDQKALATLLLHPLQNLETSELGNTRFSKEDLVFIKSLSSFIFVVNPKNRCEDKNLLANPYVIPVARALKIIREGVLISNGKDRSSPLQVSHLLDKDSPFGVLSNCIDPLDVQKKITAINFVYGLHVSQNMNPPDELREIYKLPNGDTE